jgi:glycerophosphoryl diester phosphodiesterase
MFDIQGHRGCRGLLPENTIEAFLQALQIGVPTLEMDTVISKDCKVVVSHDAYMCHEICTQPNKEEINEGNEKQFNLYQMNYAEIQLFDCGLKPHPRFPNQKKQDAHKPLLRSVVQAVNKYIQKTARKMPVFYNIETKSKPETDLIFHPKPAEFAALLYEEIERCNIVSQTMIQSFDVRTLQWLKENNKPIRLSLLVEPQDEENPENLSFDFTQKIAELGFMPDIYSPFYKLVTPQLIDFARKNKIKVIPWTVNDDKEMLAMKELGVDGFISDYPDLAMQAVNC